jgi:hypothetical protein
MLYRPLAPLIGRLRESIICVGRVTARCGVGLRTGTAAASGTNVKTDTGSQSESISTSRYTVTIVTPSPWSPVARRLVEALP